jgi:hypothetical protein
METIADAHPPALGGMSDAEFDAQIQVGYDEMLQGKARPASDVFEDIKKERPAKNDHQTLCKSIAHVEAGGRGIPLEQANEEWKAAISEGAAALE